MSKKQHKLIYKLYQPDGTYIKVLNSDDILSSFSVNKIINGGVGSLSVVIKKPIDDYDEYDASKNPTGAIKYGNRLKVFLNDDDNTDTQIFYGYLVAIGPEYSNGEETVELTFYGAVSKLSNDYYNTSGSPPYEPTEPAGFYVEETSSSASTIIKNILDNYILQTSNPMVSYTWGTSIDDCANSVSYIFDRMKWLDSLRKIEEYLPTTWYWYVDGTGLLYVKDSSSQTEHRLIIGKHIDAIKAHKNIESVINYFLLWNGRSTADASYVFRYDSDATSKSDYDRITLFDQDSSVLDDSVADIRKAKVIAYRKDPKQELTIELNDSYDLASLEPGHRVSIRNIKSDNQTTFADDLVIKRISYRIDTALIELGEVGADLTRATSAEETLFNNSIKQAQTFSENLQAGETPITEANIQYSGSDFIKEDVIDSFTSIGNCIVGVTSVEAVLKSYGKTGYADASVGFILEKDSSDDVKFELYANADAYLRFDTSASPALNIRGGMSVAASGSGIVVEEGADIEFLASSYDSFSEIIFNTDGTADKGWEIFYIPTGGGGYQAGDLMFLPMSNNDSDTVRIGLATQVCDLVVHGDISGDTLYGDPIYVGNSSWYLQYDSDGIESSKSLIPLTDNALYLGTSSQGWGRVYIGADGVYWYGSSGKILSSGTFGGNKLNLVAGTNNPTQTGDIVNYASGAIDQFRGRPGDGSWTGSFDMTAY